jgi:hypothetical protein
MAGENQLLRDGITELETLLYSENSPLIWEEFSPDEFNDIWGRLEELLIYWKEKAQSNPGWQEAERKARAEREQRVKAWEDANPEAMRERPEI